MTTAYNERKTSTGPQSFGDQPSTSPNDLSKAIMTQALRTTKVDYNGPIWGWTSDLTGCFDNLPGSFQDYKFVVPKPGYYQISYSIPYQMTPEVAASFDGINHPGFVLFTCDNKLLNFHRLPTINTPNLKCFVSSGTITATVTWKLQQGSELIIFYMSSSENHNVNSATMVPLVIAPDPHQYAWWSIVRLHV